MSRERRTKWLAIGMCGLLTAVAVYTIVRATSRRSRARDPKVEKVRELIAEADELLHQFR